MFGLFKNAGVNAARKEIEALTRILRVGTEEEMAAALFSFLISQVTIRQKYSPNYQTAIAALDNPSVLRTHNDRASVAELVSRLKKVHRAIMAQDTDEGLRIVGGYPIVIQSLNAVAFPELLPEGREMWSHLLRGLPLLPMAVAAGASDKAIFNGLDHLVRFPSLLAPGANEDTIKAAVWDVVGLPQPGQD